MKIKNTAGSIWRKWDLHLHSTASDGKCTPQQLIDAAKEKGIAVIALTDHHTVNNLDETKRLGQEQGISVISGIEFRTEYGNKSVHMIGLFPDVHNGIKLDENALNDLILGPLNLSRTHIIAAARGKHPQLGDDEAYKKGLLLVQVQFKEAADLVHKYGGIISVHAGAKSNSFEVEMKHEGKGASNVSELADSLGTVKEELLEHYIDVCEVRKDTEAGFYLAKGKPAIVASDAHKLEEFARNFTWIKAEPSFEGLRQILFEPEARVRIQLQEPEQKNDYLVIETLHIDHPDFGKQEIPFNPGLTTIIGGRSSGKSILLGCIARLCGDTTEVKKSRPKYNAYIQQIANGMSLEWKDRNKDGCRKIDFFPQNHIIELASDPAKVSGLVEQLLRADPQIGSKLEEVNSFIIGHPSSIHSAFAQYEEKLRSCSMLRSEIENLGNKNGVKQQVEKYRCVLQDMDAEMPSSITADDIALHRVVQKGIDEKNAKIELCTNAAKALRSLQQLQIINDVNLNMYHALYEIDEELAAEVTEKYTRLAEQLEKEWNAYINALIESQKEKREILQQEIEKERTNETYCRVRETQAKNTKYLSIQTLLESEMKRLALIEQKEANMESLERNLERQEAALLAEQKQYYSRMKRYCDTVSLEKGDISIKPHVVFETSKWRSLVESAFDARTVVNQDILNYQYENPTGYFELIKEMFHNLLEQKYSLKGGKASLRVLEELLALNCFRIDYNIQYQGDELANMSEGKVAFVILRLLLDFSESDYPILIDQPEDDLDNRAIYLELVKYLRDKKQHRQIILATHNPNIVVGADAEEIIVANQNGVDSKNPDGVKFAYYSGALEDSFKKEGTCEVLLSRGIKEHVCEILEGGEQAFRVREDKYQLHS